MDYSLLISSDALVDHSLLLEGSGGLHVCSVHSLTQSGHKFECIVGLIYQ